LARDCRPTREAEKGAFVGASVDPKRECPDDDLVFSALQGIQEEKKEKQMAKNGLEKKSAKKARVVKF